MAVTEALMSLFLKESVSTERVLATVRRLDKNKSYDGGEFEGLDPEEALMLWVGETCRAVKKKAEDEIRAVEGGQVGVVVDQGVFRSELSGLVSRGHLARGNHVIDVIQGLGPLPRQMHCLYSFLHMQALGRRLLAKLAGLEFLFVCYLMRQHQLMKQFNFLSPPRSCHMCPLLA
jgi:hypothetical protein